jgi:hypothetical protein
MSPGSNAPSARARRLVDELIQTAEALLADGATTGELKIVTAAVRELHEAFRLFAAYRHVRKVSTFGSARTRPGDATFRVAEEFARRIADAGFMVITGAGGGIMEACQRGAGRERSFGLNIRLPEEQDANPIIEGDPKLLVSRFFFTRKLVFLKEAHAVVLFPGGFGTHDEGFETLTLLQTGKCQPLPLVLLDRPGGTYWKTWQRYIEDHLLRREMIARDDLALYKVAADVGDAVEEVTRFYRVFHSARYVRDLLVLRLNRPLPEAFVRGLSAEFADLLVGGAFVQRAAFPVEREETEIRDLPRLAFRFNRLHFGRLRMLIDRINLAPER